MTSKTNFFSASSVFRIAVMILLISSMAFAQDNSKYERVMLAIDSVRSSYEKITNRSCPSINILIHTPEDYIFVSSATEGTTPLTKDTYFRFASNTKNFTSASILNMQEDGWLNIKAHITDIIPGSNMPYVPDTPEFDIPYKSQITIEQLLQHAAGVYDVDNDSVPGYGGLSYVDYMTFKNPAHQFELKDLVEQAAINKLSFFPPGQGYHYSNTGYTMLSEIIERVYTFRSGSKKLYADYINDFITGNSTKVPLDISFPYLASDNTMRSPFVTGALITPDSTAIYSAVNMSAHVGEGNGYATFAELDKYVRALMKGENVLTQASVQLMQKSVSEHNKTYGLGCIYIEDLGYGHNGCIKGYLSNMLYDPITDVSLIIMMPVNDYTFPDEGGIVHGLKALANAGFKARIALGFSGKDIGY